MNNILVKLLEPPGAYRRVKELIYRYRNNINLWNKNNDIYNVLNEPITQEKQEIEFKNPGLNWEIIWKKWAGIKSPAIQSRLYVYLHDKWLTGETAFNRHLTVKLPKCRLCGKCVD